MKRTGKSSGGRWPRWPALLALLATSAACGTPATPAAAPPVARSAPAPEPRWPDTPLTPLARDLLAASEAALAGEPTDVGRVELRSASGPRVDGACGRPAGSLDFVAFLVRIEARLGEAWLTIAYWLDRERARLVQLERRGGPASTVPAPAGLQRAARATVGAVAEGRASVTPADVADVTLPPAPSESERSALRALARRQSAGEVRVVDVALLVRDEEGARWLLELTIVDADDERVVLRSDPMLTFGCAARRDPCGPQDGGQAGGPARGP